MQTITKPILYVAGHSAGHILPAVTLAQKSNYPAIFIASQRNLDKQILEPYAFINKKYFLQTSGNKITKPFIIFFALIKSIIILLKNRPQKVVTTSGLIAVPTCLAATILRIPFEIYELNVEPGRSTTLLAPFANKINICFQETKKHISAKAACFLTQYPIRFTDEDKKLNKEGCLKQLNLQPYKKTLLILGGSQGALAVNKIIHQVAPHLKYVQIIHQTGAQDQTDYQSYYKELGIDCFITKYFNNIEILLTASDLVICRSGAGTLAEIIFFENKCITIPLEANTTNHQVQNGLAAEKDHPALIKCINQADIEKDILKFAEFINQII